MSRRDLNGRRYCNGQFVPDPLSRAGIAELLRAAAAGMEPERAALVRKRARILEGRERPGEVRKHRRGASP